MIGNNLISYSVAQGDAAQRFMEARMNGQSHWRFKECVYRSANGALICVDGFSTLFQHRGHVFGNLTVGFLRAGWRAPAELVNSVTNGGAYRQGNALKARAEVFYKQLEEGKIVFPPAQQAHMQTGTQVHAFTEAQKQMLAQAGAGAHIQGQMQMLLAQHEAYVCGGEGGGVQGSGGLESCRGEEAQQQVIEMEEEDM